MSTYLFPSCNNNSLYRHLWLVYNQCSGSTSFWNQNIQRRNNIPLHHIVANSHQWTLYSFGILVDLILICFQDLAYIQMGRGLYLPKNNRSKFIYFPLSKHLKDDMNARLPCYMCVIPSINLIFDIL